MKYILVVGDGMADYPLPQLNQKTPLEYAAMKHAGALASSGEFGLVTTVPDGIAPGTDTAFITILGYDVYALYSGRAPLEAAGMGITLSDGSAAFRCNLAAISGDSFDGSVMESHSGGQIPADDGRLLMEFLCAEPEMKKLLNSHNMKIHVGTSFRHILERGGENAHLGLAGLITTPPHDIVGKPINGHLPRGGMSDALNEAMSLSFRILPKHPINLLRKEQGLLPANCIWPWGQGTNTSFTPFYEKFRVHGATITAVPLVSGLGSLTGLINIPVDGATGELDTNYSGKANAAISALKDGMDFVLVHVEAPDECGHNGNIDDKVEAIRRVDMMLGMLLDGANKLSEPFRIMLISDHATPLALRTHTSDPVPYCIYDSRDNLSNGVASFDEKSAKASERLLRDGTQLMPRLFGEWLNALT